MIKFKTLTGDDVEIKDEAMDAFKLKIKGSILLPGAFGYDDSRTLWNGMFDRKPSMIIKSVGTADVIAAVQFAKENSLLLCIKGGGHNIGGLATSEGALMLDMSLMRGVWIDAEKKIAHAQAGCLLADVDRESQLYGLATVLGFVSQTGVAGLTLGGGFGYLTRRWGWTSDNVTNFDIVTHEGKLIKANNKENPDLFWGLRGGGGNFGVVTGIDYKLYDVGPEILGGLVAWPVSEAEKVLELYRTISSSAPHELTLVTLVRPAPPAPWLPKEIHGKLIVGILAFYSGNLEEGEKLVAPIKGFGKPVGDILIRRPYVQMQSLLDATQPKGRRYYWKSEYLPEIKPEILDKVILHAEKIKSPHSAIILFQIGGALNEISGSHSPVGNREAKYVLNISGAWDNEADDDINKTWARDAWSDMKEFSTGGTYINFLNDDEGPERNKAAYGNSIEKLIEVKQKWDPDNLFRTNRNIKIEKSLA